jgi:hypothetical protein
MESEMCPLFSFVVVAKDFFKCEKLAIILQPKKKKKKKLVYTI